MRSLTTIAVIGATGTAGSRVVARLKARGVAVVEISRAHGVDVISGRGLFEALAGVDVVIDVSNPMPTDGQSGITETVTTATRNIVGACAAREIQRLVVLTIAGIEDPVFDGFPYYEAKRAAKEIVLDSPVPATIVKSTQWYEFASNPAAVTSHDGEVVVQDARGMTSIVCGMSWTATGYFGDATTLATCLLTPESLLLDDGFVYVFDAGAMDAKGTFGGMSAGAAVFPRDGQTYEALLATADSRMYRDKSERKARHARTGDASGPAALVT